MLVVRNFNCASDYLGLIAKQQEMWERDGEFLSVICDAFDDDKELDAILYAKECKCVCVRVNGYPEDPNLWDGAVVVDYLNQ